MPRPQRKRRIDCYPEQLSFVPEDANRGELDTVVLTLDEYETIRLLDYCGMTQEQCAASMEVSRTTVTAIYESARRKVADALVNGRRLLFSGGEVRQSSTETAVSSLAVKQKKGVLRLAVTCEDGQIAPHFGRAHTFQLLDIQDGEIICQETICCRDTPAGSLPGILKAAEVDVLICASIGPGARLSLSGAGISLLAGAHGAVEEAVAAYLAGTLSDNTSDGCEMKGNCCSAGICPLGM